MKRLAALISAAAVLIVAGCVTSHDGVDAITGVAINVLIWSVP